MPTTLITLSDSDGEIAKQELKDVLDGAAPAVALIFDNSADAVAAVKCAQVTVETDKVCKDVQVVHVPKPGLLTVTQVDRWRGVNKARAVFLSADRKVAVRLAGTDAKDRAEVFDAMVEAQAQ